VKNLKSNHIIEIRDLNKEFNGLIILKGINVNISEGEFVTILGPSGCGKTTLLRILAGFENPTSGSIKFLGNDISKLSPHLRPLNTVFQDYALFPHMDVYDNVAYPLRLKKYSKNQIEKEVMAILKLVHLEKLESSSISELSGGQKQRVAIARALVSKPKALLLDEPLSALDKKLRESMQRELKSIQKAVGITFIFVTHDQEEALTMSDKIIILNDGELQQIGTPREVYDEPENEWVANFVGNSNIIPSIMIKDSFVFFDEKSFPCVDKGFGKNNPVDVVLRPEDILFTNSKTKRYFEGKILSVQYKGSFWEFYVKTKFRTFLVQSLENINSYKANDVVGIYWHKSSIHVMWKVIDE